MSSKSEDEIPMADEVPDEQLVVEEDDNRRRDEATLDYGAAGVEDDDLSTEEQEEKARLIAQVLELQNTLDDLSSRVDNVKEENLRLRSENQVLGQYIENLMAASNVFQTASEQQPRGKRK